MVIVVGFQILVDGWLTKLSAPIVIYDDRHTTGVRFPFDIPIEDFLFGFAMVTAVLLLWEQRRTDRDDDREAAVSGPPRRGARRVRHRCCQPTTNSSAPTPATTRTCAFRRSECGSPNRAAACGCSTPDAAPARRRPRCSSVAPEAEIVAIDASARHARAGDRTKSWPPSVRFVHSHVEDLADAGVDGPFDGILAAYLMRNLADPDATLRRLRELLRPGAHAGRARVLGARLAAAATAMWNAVCWGDHHSRRRLRTGDATLYQYLRRSVDEFDGARHYGSGCATTGFTGVHSETMPGWQRDDRAHLPRGRAVDDRSTVAATVPAPPGLPDATALSSRAARGRRRRRHRGTGGRDRAGRTRRRRRRRRTGELPGWPGRRVDTRSSRRRRRSP